MGSYNTKYKPGYAPERIKFLERRSADVHAHFIFSIIRPTYRILDCGCGPGTITQGLARLVSRGTVTGIDVAESQIDRSRENALIANVENVLFERQDVYELELPTNHFDLVYANALLEHLEFPEKALSEMTRVLRPGGYLALRSPLWSKFRISPYNMHVDSLISSYAQSYPANDLFAESDTDLLMILQSLGLSGFEKSESIELHMPPCDFLTAIHASLAQIPQTPFNTEAETNCLNYFLIEKWGLNNSSFLVETWQEVIGIK
jgi:SAM-dependent methyltransferase